MSSRLQLLLLNQSTNRFNNAKKEFALISVLFYHSMYNIKVYYLEDRKWNMEINYCDDSDIKTINHFFFFGNHSNGIFFILLQPPCSSKPSLTIDEVLFYPNPCE